MPNVMPRFDNILFSQSQIALQIVKAAELMRTSGGEIGRQGFTIEKLEYLYEFAFLRSFASWESCLESILHRSLCGYYSRQGREILFRGYYCKNIAEAESLVLGSQQYFLWHNTQRVIKKCKSLIRTGFPGCLGLQESVLSSYISKIDDMSHIRHRIVHDQSDAKRKFDNVTRSLSAKVYPKSRPGKFLRDWDQTSSVRRRWIDTLITDLVSIATQMV